MGETIYFAGEPMMVTNWRYDDRCPDRVEICAEPMHQHAYMAQRTQIEGNRLTLAAAHRILCPLPWWNGDLYVDVRGGRQISPPRFYFPPAVTVDDFVSTEVPETTRRRDFQRVRAMARELTTTQEFMQSLLRGIAGITTPIVPWVRAQQKKEEEETRRRLRAEAWEPIPGLKTIFHPAGLFHAPDGRRFDYVFPELMRAPDLPLGVIPTLDQLGQHADPDVRFVGRHRDPDYDRTQIGRTRR